MAPRTQKTVTAPPPPPAGPAPQKRPGGRLGRKKLALIHVVKKELGLADTDYRRVLWLVAGVRSARDLDEAGFRKLMRYFVRSDYFRANAQGMTLKQKLYVKSLSSDLGCGGGPPTELHPQVLSAGGLGHLKPQGGLQTDRIPEGHPGPRSPGLTGSHLSTTASPPVPVSLYRADRSRPVWRMASRTSS